MKNERQSVFALVEDQGLRAAVTAAIEVCADRDAPAPARATAAGLLLRAGAFGGFGANGADERGTDNKDLDDMTPEELNAAVVKALAYLEGRGSQAAAEGAEPDIFD
ncbi:hypothetical protein IHQ68_03350 [Chelatococcus sambhunathii]|uniref:Uncharacterized protein n=1 Tax=Chelatococcus sambhunathii TaxID=363953 RepID=A0ABU1DC16_9HYPH|nr:hypothetical protein [Chelatococcus sambhunathii]MDR4305658.1 hypothetical protein [Chelatococcus sambhunathii]